MEDENGLDLGLGLSCGGLSVKSKGKIGSSSDARTEEGDRGNKLVDDFKNFLQAGTQKQDSSTGSQRSDSVKPQENFFNDLTKTNVEADVSINLNGRGIWVASSNKSAEMEEEKRLEVGNKRKMLFDEMNHQKKLEREAHADLHDKTRTSHISITTEDGSTAENEDVAESEVEGSTSRLVSQHDDGSKRFFGVGASSEVHGFADSSVLDLNGQKRFNSPSENEFKLGNVTYGVPFIQSLNMMNVPYSLPVKESSSVGAPSTAGHPLPAKTRYPGGSDRAIFPVTNPRQSHSMLFNLTDELPKTVARTLNQGSIPTSMDFHPVQQTLLLVGTILGDISLWEVSSREKMASRNFQVWNIGASSLILKATLIKDPCVSVKRIAWSPDGSLFGVAYSKHIMQLYTYHSGNDIHQHLEIDAHVGSVNDLAFCHPTKQLSVITCGDDKTIKVWDAATGAKLYTFEGHDAPVHSVCPHCKENVHFVFSTSVDGKIKAWLYDMMGSRVDYDAPGRSCTTMAYSADGRRLFSCGTSKDGESHIVEWNENEGHVKRAYQGLNKRSLGIVQFDSTKNRFLAVGDEYTIKVWDMDNPNILTSIDAEGGLPASPRIRFNKEGTLLAVSANDNRIKILATIDGMRLMHTYENHSLVAARSASETVTRNGDTRNLENVKPKLAEEVNQTKIWKLTEISEPAQFRSLKLPSRVKSDKISRLIYTNSGTGILALAANAIHLLWKWQRCDPNLSGKATTKASPQLVQPPSGITMTNDLTDAKPEDALSCFALSKNDSYVMSASGGKISLFNMMTFKVMTTFMPPPPAATYLAFHPQDNNIIAVGMDDSTILIYNVRVDEVKSKLKGHSKRITGLAFSHALNVLVSSGADAQIIVWNSDKWERQNNSFLQIPAGRTSMAMSDTQVQFHQDQIHFLVVHGTQLAIYETKKLECVKQWVVEESSPPISHAIFSCDSQLIYAGFLDGTVRVFGASNLQLRCQINPTAYLHISSSVYPLVIAANPQDPNQFAIGLTDGGVHVFEPLESEGKWGVPPPVENGSPNRIPTMPPLVASGLDQPQC